MIPQQMDVFLRKNIPGRTWQNRLQRAGDLCFMEFNTLDVDRLARLGIQVDNLGPHLVVCMWDAASPLEIGGYLVVDNLAMGKPAMGGIRMLPDITPAAVHNLARGMTLKNAAANLPYGGGKSGIVAGRNLTGQQHTQAIKGFARLLYRYKDIYLPGPDVGTNDADMKTIAIENGIDHALSKPVEMGGNRIDQLGAAAGGVVIALDALLTEMTRLRVLPQFNELKIPHPSQLSILIQGFGAVGAHAGHMLQEHIPGSRVTGISDMLGYLYNPEGLPVPELFEMWEQRGIVSRPYYIEKLMADGQISAPVKFSSDPDDLLRESAYCLVPAAPIANYLDTDPSTQPCITVDQMGRWQVIVEGANTYSPDPARKQARARMERVVYRQLGTLIATDYLVNSGGVIFAAQEHIIKTPQELRFPAEILGDRAAVDRWLDEHAQEFEDLAARRLQAATTFRDEVIRRNMRELIDLLASDADMLPCEAAEKISIRRIASREADRSAADLMMEIPTIICGEKISDAARALIDTGSPILAVLSEQSELLGVLTSWDLSRAVAQAIPFDQDVVTIMTADVISAGPNDRILDLIRKLEHYEISSMPVVSHGQPIGMVSADLLARRSLYRLLQKQEIEDGFA